MRSTDKEIESYGRSRLSDCHEFNELRSSFFESLLRAEHSTTTERGVGLASRQCIVVFVSRFAAALEETAMSKLYL